MRYFDFLRDIKEISTSHILVNEYSEGDIYEYLNAGEHKYPCVFLTVTNISTSLSSSSINFTLFYTDRLLENGSNKTAIQSTGIQVIKQILSRFEESNPEYQFNSVNYTPFTEKFSDMCAGVFGEISVDNLDSLENLECEDGEFELKEITLTENGVYDILGYDRAIVAVDSNCEEYEAILLDKDRIIESQYQEIDSLVNSNEIKDIEIYERDSIINSQNKQINSVTNIAITQNGTYTPPTDVLGYNEITVDVVCGGGVEESVLVINEGARLIFKNETLQVGLDTSNLTTVNYLFASSNLTTIPIIDTSNATIFANMFNACGNLITIPTIDTSKGTNFNYMFYKCNNLNTVPILDTSKGTNFVSTFYNCSALNTVEQINISGVTQKSTISNMFYNCSSLENITLEGSINTSVDFLYCIKLTYNSVKSILTAASNTTNTNAKVLTFDITHTDNNGELANLIAECITKGWTISGLTLN